MNVFLSSVISGFEDYRSASAQAIQSLGHKLIRAEDYGASNASPQETCLSGVREADVVVLVLGQRYGSEQASGLSATHEEYREAKERCQVLAFVQKSVAFESRQEAFVSEVQDWVTGTYTSTFTSPDDLRDGVVQQLHRLELSQAAAPMDTPELLARSNELISALEERGPALVLAIAPGPTQQILRPAELESRELSRALLSMGMLGDHSILSPTVGSQTQIQGHGLLISQEGASVLVDELGGLRLSCQAVEPSRGLFGSGAIVEEDVLSKVITLLKLSAGILDYIDAPHRVSRVVPTLGLFNSGYHGWSTRAEQDRQPNTWSPTNKDRVVVSLRPENRMRSSLMLNTTELAQDFIVLLRRQVRSNRF